MEAGPDRPPQQSDLSCRQQMKAKRRMKAAVYEQVREDLARKGLAAAREAHPDVEFDTVMAIFWQENSRRLRTQHHKFRALHNVQQCIGRYAAGEDVLEICQAFEMPPCLLARILLENMVGMSKQQVSACLKDPTHLPEVRICVKIPGAADGQEQADVCIARLRQDLYRCVAADDVSSPTVEMIRRVGGVEYESLLCEELEKLGIAFQSEDALRAAGFSKTPDVKLEVPVGVKGRIVNWIDSKASFGDEYNHTGHAMDQFQSYVNRFGPGMVIYWFGYIEELDDHRDVLLMDRFPEESEFFCLPSLLVQRRG